MDNGESTNLLRISMREGTRGCWKKVVKIDPPMVTMPVDSCNKIVEQWKWTEFGDMIRGLSVGAVQLG